MRKIVSFIRFFFPPDKWKFAVIIIIGIISGIGGFLFYISNAASYLSDDPKTCMNCHIMAPQYATWSHSAHREVATCNDCHVPHDNFFHTYLFKAQDGMRHATIFTLRKEPQVIFIRDAGKEVVFQNCIRCHGDMISKDRIFSADMKNENLLTKKYCWDCHRETPHGRVNSLSSVPNAKVPVLDSPVPDWLIKLMKKEK